MRSRPAEDVSEGDVPRTLFRLPPGDPTDEERERRRRAAVRSGWVEELKRFTALVIAMLVEVVWELLMAAEVGGGGFGGGYWRAVEGRS